METIYQFLQRATEILDGIPLIGPFLKLLYVRLLGEAPDAVLVAISIAVPILFIITVYPLIFAYTTLIERKALARIQNRIGPNRVGRWGILQPIADGLKLLLKEDIVPRSADKVVHWLAPVIAVIPSLLLFAVVPVGPGLVPVDLNIGILFVFAVSTASVLALFMGGWASRNKFSLLGAMRAVAQVVSYELPMVLSAVVVLMAVGSMSTVAIVQAQAGGVANLTGWFVFTPWGFVGFVLFVIGAMAESARTPFDIPEAESEIIAGYHTEYSGFKFALFQLGEYLAAIAMAGIGVTMFLGGYLGPGSGPGLLGGLISMFWFFAKLMTIVLVIIWIRGTWPRIRVDQLLAFAWKVLLPMSLINIVAFALWHYLGAGPLGWMASGLLLAASFLALSWFSATDQIEKRVYRYAA
jgi:NADH-quinone oxidoreductase subunit H